MPVDALAWLPSASRNPPTTSICHNSIGAARSQRLNRSARRRRTNGSTRPARTSARYTADSDGSCRAGTSPRRTISERIRRGPQYRCRRRNSNTTASAAAGI